MASPLIISLKKRKSFYGSKIHLLSPAKINLYLNIKGEYPDGFHRIESVAERISLCDKISIRIIRSPVIRLSSQPEIVETKDNLVFKAAQLIRKKFKIPFGFDISLRKKIPIGAGLGGGSSNAASTLLGLNRLLNLRIKKENIYSLGRQLGSDVNFFLSESRFALLTGRGDKVIPMKIKSKLDHFVVWPDLSVSTKKVYSNLRANPPAGIHTVNGRGKAYGQAELTKNFNNANIIRCALSRSNIPLVKKSVFNALENSALSLYSRLKQVKMRLERRGIFVNMTGSGSAFYTVGMVTTLNKLKRLVPGKWAVFKVSTF